MFEKAKSGRDAFTFSLGGMTTIASFTVAPAVDQNRLNQAIDQRLGGMPQEPRNTVLAIENFLAHYFAPAECRRTA